MVCRRRCLCAGRGDQRKGLGARVPVQVGRINWEKQEIMSTVGLIDKSTFHEL